jgi:predicted dehydrogenase
MSDVRPISLGVTGLGGYGAQIATRLLEEAAKDRPIANLLAVCDPNMDRWPQRVSELQSHGVSVLPSFDDLLALPIDAVWLPLPIHQHREYTERAAVAGKAVMVEKPAAGNVEDVDAMIAARDRARTVVSVGYQDLFQPAVWEVKRRIVRGDFGIVLSASVLGCWPRGEWYFNRNSWAGAISRDGKWVLDSPANNAMAHYLNLAQFLLGPTERESATPSEVEAELYRANAIENYDTCSLRLTFSNGAHLLVAMTHACQTSIEPLIVIRTQFARIRVFARQRIEIQTNAATERINLLQDHFAPMLETMSRWIHEGFDAQMQGGTLEMARAHTVAINAASEIAPIVQLPGDVVQTVESEKGPLRIIPGIELAMKASIEAGRMLHESRRVAWSQPAQDVLVHDYRSFKGPRSPSASA